MATTGHRFVLQVERKPVGSQGLTDSLRPRVRARKRSAVTRRDLEHCDYVLDAVEAIRNNLGRGGLTDRLVFDAVEQDLPKLEAAGRRLQRRRVQ